MRPNPHANTNTPNSPFQYPLHLLNLSSARDLESKIPKDAELRHLDPRRFRANLISAFSPD